MSADPPAAAAAEPPTGGPADLIRVLGTGGELAAYALSHAVGGSGARTAGDSSGRAADHVDRTGGSAAESLHAFTAADLASPWPGQRGEPAAVRDGEVLLHTAERAAFGPPGSWPGSPPAAGRLTEDALALARDAGDRPQAARLMYCLARQQIDLGHPGEALELAAAGTYAIRRAPTPRASALLHIAQARAHACAGDEQDCRTALGTAQEIYARDGTDPEWCGFFDDSEIRGLTGVALRDLAAASPGRAARIATEAREWIEQAAASRPRAFMRSKVFDTDGIAVASILAHEPDRAAAAARQAITLSRHVHSPRAAGRLQATVNMGSRAFPRDPAWPALAEQARSLPSAR